ncbi:MAG: glycosyltransferase family 4 protein [Steroidobacterales bacterium]
MSAVAPPLKVLLEMRTALEADSGLGTVSRLLFRSLSSLDGVHVEGLLQSVDRHLAEGLPAGGRASRLDAADIIYRLGQVVITLEDEASATWPAGLRTVRMALGRLLGASHELTRFEARFFQDYVWRRLFARTLPPTDFDVVTRASYRVMRIPWNALHICAYVTGRMGLPVFARLDTADFDLMICETPYPGTVSRGTQLVIHYHDAIPVLMPHTISKQQYHQAFHYQALRRNVTSGAWFVCVSEAVRQDLLAIFPQVDARSVTIHNMVSPLYFDEPSEPARVPQIIAARLNTQVDPPLDAGFTRGLFSGHALSGPIDYLLMVSKIEPRKNHLTLLSAWERLRSERYPGLKLLVVGPVGLRQEAILRRFRPWLDRGEVFLLRDLSAAEIRVLYKHARATLCPSFSEGFDLSGVEAMKSGGAVIASDIPTHREIFADAAEFFNPYRVSDLCRAVGDVIDPAHAARREELVRNGAAVCKRYDEDVILPRWEAFLRARAVAS